MSSFRNSIVKKYLSCYSHNFPMEAWYKSFSCHLTLHICFIIVSSFCILAYYLWCCPSIIWSVPAREVAHFWAIKEIKNKQTKVQKNNIFCLRLAHCQPNGREGNPGSARGCIKGTRWRVMVLQGKVLALQSWGHRLRSIETMAKPSKVSNVCAPVLKEISQSNFTNTANIGSGMVVT